MKVQSSLLGPLEDAIRQHERTCSEKAALERKIEAKVTENLNLKTELDNLKSDPSIDRSQELENTVSRISACEAEVSTLKGKIEELESILEEQGMQVKCEKSTVILRLMEWSQQARICFEKKLKVEDELRARIQSLEEESDREVNYTHQHKWQREATSGSFSSKEEIPTSEKEPKLGILITYMHV